MAASFQSGLLFAAAISGAGVLTNLVLLGRRYTHDSWEPPTQAWATTRGEVVDVRKTYIDGQAQGAMWWEVEYSFEVRGTTRSFTLNYGSRPEDIEVGESFEVWYKPSHPEVHEMRDFRPAHLPRLVTKL